MKKFLITSILATLVAAGTTIMAQEYPDEYLGLPGDNLNLYAVMKLFQESETIEGFERSLNDENSRINNLDLNGDNYIDYLKVIDYVDGDVHTIVLQAVLDRNETQDAAVFTVQRLRDGSVQIQLTGDEALYGRNYIIEPILTRRRIPATSEGKTQTLSGPQQFKLRPGRWYDTFICLNLRRMALVVVLGATTRHIWHPGVHSTGITTTVITITGIRDDSHYRHWDNDRYLRWNDFYYNGTKVIQQRQHKD